MKNPINVERASPIADHIAVTSILICLHKFSTCTVALDWYCSSWSILFPWLLSLPSCSLSFSSTLLCFDSHNFSSIGHLHVKIKHLIKDKGANVYKKRELSCSLIVFRHYVYCSSNWQFAISIKIIFCFFSCTCSFFHCIKSA